MVQGYEVFFFIILTDSFKDLSAQGHVVSIDIVTTRGLKLFYGVEFDPFFSL
jgi:hypothetical protein